MKIAFFVHGYLPWDVYGVPRHVERLASYLVEKGHKVLIIVAGRPNLEKVERRTGLTIYRTRYIDMPSKRLRPFWSFFLYTIGCLFEAPRIIEREQVDIIHGHTVQWGGFQGCMVGRLTRRPVVVTVHGSGLERYPLEKMPRRLYFLNLVNLLIIQKFSAYNKLAEWNYPRWKVYLTEGCVDTRVFAPPSTRMPMDTSIVTFVGRLTAFKGPQLLLEAAPLVLAKRRNVLFQFVGEGDLKMKLAERAKETGLASTVRFLGFRCDVDDIFRKSHVSVHLSPFENFTDFALLEAMASGVPVVATDVGETRSIVEDGSTGVLASPNPRDVARKILKILEEPELAESLARNERAMIINHYSLDIFGAKHVRLYEAVISGEEMGFLQ
jgi:glycosyltransferase involved in cell wall biosynthesis